MRLPRPQPRVRSHCKEWFLKATLDESLPLGSQGASLLLRTSLGAGPDKLVKPLLRNGDEVGARGSHDSEDGLETLSALLHLLAHHHSAGVAAQDAPRMHHSIALGIHAACTQAARPHALYTQTPDEPRATSTPL